MLIRNGFIIIALALAGCGKEKAEDKIEPIDPAPPEVVNDHAETSERLEAKFLDRGWVVSIRPDGHFGHQGDSLIFSGLYIAASKCDGALLTEQTLQRSIAINGGQIRRHADIDDASLDGLVGLLRGVARRYKLGCATFDAWKEPLEALKTYADGHNGAFNHNSASGLDAHSYLLDLLLDRLAGGNSPDYRADRRDFLSGVMGAWPDAIRIGYVLARQSQKDPPAAFRVNLALQTLEALEDLGVPVKDSARNQFCTATKDFDMPTSDHWCGRKSILSWLAGFEYNVWEYRHQRAALWETPDGNGYETPAVDKLEGLRDGYKL